MVCPLGNCFSDKQMSLNRAEMISTLYLRLNGFFLVENFVAHRSHGRGHSSEIDLLGLRPPRVYQYLSGSEFKQRVQAIVETFVTMQDELEQEKRAMSRIWSKREKQIYRIIDNTAGMYGDVQGIIGASLPQIEVLELEALGSGEAQEKNKETSADSQ